MSLKETNTLLNKATIDRLYLFSSKGVHIDLSSIFVTLFVYENLLENYLQADLIITDDLNIMQALSFSGDEYVYVKYATTIRKDLEEYNKTLVFKVFSVSPSANLENGKIYTLRLVSRNYFYNSTNAVSRTMRGTVSDVVSDIYLNYLGVDGFGTMLEKRLAVEETINSVNRCFPFSSPVQIINELATIAVSKYETSDFLFYETVNGSVFRSLSNMIDSASRAVLPIYEAGTANATEDPKQTRDSQIQASYVLNYQFQEKMQLDIAINKGMFASRTLVYDPFRKTNQLYLNAYGDAYFDKTPSLNEYAPVAFPTPLSQNFNSKLYCLPQTSTTFTPTSKAAEHLSSIPWYHANRSMNKMSRVWDSCVMTINGDSSLTVGQGVYFRCPHFISDGNSANLYDKYLSGRYLIMSLKHSISRNSFETTMEIIKDSAMSPVPSKIQSSE